MKPLVPLLCVALLAGGASSMLAQNQPAPRPSAVQSPAGAAVEVNFIEPDKFTDMRYSFGERGADAGYMQELQRYIEERAARRLAPGQRLQINITDVDMAGDFEPHRGADFNHVRIVRSIYLPRIRLTFTLTDATGAVLESGERNLSDLTFTHHVDPINRHDPLQHEKRLIDTFLRDVEKVAKPRR